MEWSKSKKFPGRVSNHSEPCLDWQRVQVTPEDFHSSPSENAVRWAQSLLPPQFQDFLNNRGRNESLEVISSADKETEIEILHCASIWSANKEGTKS